MLLELLILEFIVIRCPNECDEQSITHKNSSENEQSSISDPICYFQKISDLEEYLNSEIERSDLNLSYKQTRELLYQYGEFFENINPQSISLIESFMNALVDACSSCGNPFKPQQDLDPQTRILSNYVQNMRLLSEGRENQNCDLINEGLVNLEIEDDDSNEGNSDHEHEGFVFLTRRQWDIISDSQKEDEYSLPGYKTERLGRFSELKKLLEEKRTIFQLYKLTVDPFRYDRNYLITMEDILLFLPGKFSFSYSFVYLFYKITKNNPRNNGQAIIEKDEVEINEKSPAKEEILEMLESKNLFGKRILLIVPFLRRKLKPTKLYLKPHQVLEKYTKENIDYVLLGIICKNQDRTCYLRYFKNHFIPIQNTSCQHFKEERKDKKAYWRRNFEVLAVIYREM